MLLGWTVPSRLGISVAENAQMEIFHMKKYVTSFKLNEKDEINSSTQVLHHPIHFHFHLLRQSLQSGDSAA